VHSKNPGIRFSILPTPIPNGFPLRLIAGSFVVIAILAWYLVAAKESRRRAAAGLALLLAAPPANLLTASCTVAVTDFFEVLFGAYRYRLLMSPTPPSTIGAIF